MTRAHEDIDLFIWAADASRLLPTLKESGYKEIGGPPPDQQRNLLKDGEEFHVTLLEESEVGVVTAGGRWADFPWPKGMLDGPIGRIGDVRCRVISAEARLWAKEEAPHALSHARRDRDYSDVALLRQVVAAEESDPPWPYDRGVRTSAIDFDAIREHLSGRCFICEMLHGNPEFSHHVVYEDEQAVAFLNRYPVLYGYVLVAPKEHREQVTGDFSREDYLALQTVVHGVGEALRRVVPTERLYVLSLGSQEGNRHVHWHLAPLPPDVPFDQQQLAALDSNLCLDLSDQEMADLAARIRAAITETAEIPELTDGVVILDSYVLDDVERHLAGEDEEHARRFGWYPERSTARTVRAAFVRWRRDWTFDGPTRAFAVRTAAGRQLVGGCQIRLREKGMAELSYWTFTGYRRMGYASRAVKLGCEFAISRLGIERIEAYVEPDNVASRRVLEKSGFHQEGLVRAHELTASGQRRDMLLYSLLADETTP